MFKSVKYWLRQVCRLQFFIVAQTDMYLVKIDYADESANKFLFWCQSDVSGGNSCLLMLSSDDQMSSTS